MGDRLVKESMNKIDLKRGGYDDKDQHPISEQQGRARFDIVEKHMPLSIKLLSARL
jgi:hypothetical protein